MIIFKGNIASGIILIGNKNIYLATLHILLHQVTYLSLQHIEFTRHLDVQIQISVIDRFQFYCDLLLLCYFFCMAKACHTFYHRFSHFASLFYIQIYYSAF